MKVIIAGAGNVGTYLVEMMVKFEHDVTVIDSDKEKLNDISSHYEITQICGTMTSYDVLKNAKIDECDLFIAVSNSQDSNILACIIAKKFGVKKTIARIDNEEYLEDQNTQMLQKLGIDYLIYPEIILRDEILNYLRFPTMLKNMPIEGGKLFLFSFKVKEDYPFVNKSLVELQKEFPKLSARVVSIFRNGETIIPRGNDKILEEDVLYIITDKTGIELVESSLHMKDKEAKNIMILGGSRIGIKLAQVLQKHCNVKLFEKDKQKSLEIAAFLEETLVLHSEARTADFLLEEGIQNTDVFIAVTGNSELNLISCMLAKKLGVKKTFAEVENTDYLDLISNLDVDYVFNKKYIAASKIFSYAIDPNVINLHFFTDIDANFFEVIVEENAPITKKKIKDINLPHDIIIGGLIRKDYCEIVTGETQILTGDKVVIVTKSDDFDSIISYFKSV